MARERQVNTRSELDVPDHVAWAHATTLAGVQRELPWPLRLTTRPEVTAIDEFVAAGDVVAVLRAGRVPLLRWRPRLVELGERHFVEASRDMTGVRAWRHERRVTACDGGCIVEDLVRISPRMPGGHLLVRWLFARRHRRLRDALTR